VTTLRDIYNLSFDDVGSFIWKLIIHFSTNFVTKYAYILKIYKHGDDEKIWEYSSKFKSRNQY